MTLKKTTQRLAQQLLGAIAFYTTIPVSASWTLDFTRIARWSPFVGVLIGAILALVDGGLAPYCPTLLRSAIVISLWIGLTGALHLDGAMDTADGLGVFEPQKRLEVMKDSLSGAFGVIAAILIVLLKVLALATLSHQRALALIWLPAWGRWAHVLAVGMYPYLKEQGKASLHHDCFEPAWDYLPGALLHCLIAALVCIWNPGSATGMVIAMGLAVLTLWAIGRWFYGQFKGVTGDIHGAIVEWTETLLLLEVVCLGTTFGMIS
jgi:adenosylcobinamide-GDP ribazoletransferase